MGLGVVKSGMPAPLAVDKEQVRVLVKRAGWYHIVDPTTDCATLSLGPKEAKAILGKDLRPEIYPRPIHTALGTLEP